MIAQYISQGFLLGLALSPTCLGVCLPLLLPFFSAEARTQPENWKAFGYFLAGRLSGYALMGAMAGWIGQAVAVRSGRLVWLEGAAYVLIALWLIGFSVTKTFPHWSVCNWLGKVKLSERTPFVLGLLTGINICPPFVAALYHAGQTGGVIAGTSVLAAFFLGTSFILIPIPAVGWFAKQAAIRIIGRFAAGLIGGWFLVKGILLFLAA